MPVTLPARPPAAPARDTLPTRYLTGRRRTEALAAGLHPEDCVVSSMPDVSPTKWHLAHTSWFFETFVLCPHAPGYAPLDDRYAYLFNSYYVQAGERHCRAQRGLVTRPTLREVRDYRAHVDEAMLRLCAPLARDEAPPALAALVELGLHHEQQHQELLLMDVKHVFWTNPLRPPYADGALPGAADGATPSAWCAYEGGLHDVGADADAGFTFDNERPAHRRYLAPFRLASRLVTNAEYLAFVEDGGYDRPTLWLSDGWAAVQAGGWRAPLYWERGADGWTEFTLRGAAPLAPPFPVLHLSFYEADAFARWAGARLPREEEWEVAARDAAPPDAARGFLESERWHAAPADGGAGLAQLHGEAWQWTASPYVGYPGYRPPQGAIGEYNGKFMCDQWVLRGSSFGTPRTHARHTYRNFFPSPARWHFAGLRLAGDA